MTLIPAIKLSREELNQLVIDYQRTNDNELLEKIVQAQVKLCMKLAYRFCDVESLREDCVSEGLIGVIRAARLYKPDNADNVCFCTYASKSATRHMWRFLSEFRYHNDKVSSLDEPLFINKHGDEMFLKDILVDDTFEIDEGLDPEVEKTIRKISDFMDKYFSEKAITLIRNKFGFNSEWPMPDKENAKSLGMTIEEFQSYYQKCLRAIRSHLLLKRHPLWRI
jgi:RNA polymerase sigma factor (sigma-70 family)